MSAMNKFKITNSLKLLAKIRPASEFEHKYDDTATPEENQGVLIARIERLRKEIELGDDNISTITRAIDDWFSSKRGEIDYEEENKVFEKFSKDEKLDTKLESANDTLTELRDLEEKLKAQSKVLAATVKKNDLAHAQALAAATATTSALPTLNQSLYCLPQLQIKHFTGERRYWPEFWESFRSAVDSKFGNKQNTDKLNLLRNLLDGEPRALISGLKLEDANYKIALDILKAEYGDKEDYVRTLHSELSNLPRCENLNQTRNFMLELERITREMTNVGEDINSPSIYLNLEKKLTRNFLRTILIKKREAGNKWNTVLFKESLSEMVKNETIIRDTMLEYEGENRKHSDRRQNTELHNQTKQSDRKWERIYKSDGTPKWESSYIAPIKGEPTSPCAFCEEKHYHDECTKFKSYEERIQCAKEKHLCFRCLRSNHVAQKCIRPATCYKCKSQHPTALCKEQSKRNRIRSNNSSDSEEADNCGHVKHTNRKESTMKQKKKTLLMAIEATVFNPKHPNKSMTAVIFIDNGSQRSFITKDACRRLELPVLEKEQCLLTSFGEREPKRYDSEIVKLGILGAAGDRIQCNLNKMNFLVGNLPVLQLKKMHKAELQQRKLDPIMINRKPDILLGMDMYYTLGIKFLETLPSGFVLCQSKLGKIISGQGQFEETQNSEAQVSFVSNVLEHTTQIKEINTKSESKHTKKIFERKGFETFNRSEKQNTEIRKGACLKEQQKKSETTKQSILESFPWSFKYKQSRPIHQSIERKGTFNRTISQRRNGQHKKQRSDHRQEQNTRHRHEASQRGSRNSWSSQYGTFEGSRCATTFLARECHGIHHGQMNLGRTKISNPFFVS